MTLVVPAQERAGPSDAHAAEWLVCGRHVIRAEAAALDALADALDRTFVDAIELILRAPGRVMLSGIGKSGHVARKFASTLASIGIAAYFVHPAEAAHGDLGMFVPGDLLIALSNSGSTRELMPVARHARSLGIPVVGITSRASSPLIELCQLYILLPPVEEAGPSKIAPTSSTTMMMALGDALALGVMKVRGVSRAGFGALHPGGAIGSLLQRASAVMHRAPKIPLVQTWAPMREVIVTMTGCSFGIAGVIDDDGKLVGVITDGDLRRHVDDLLVFDASQVMTNDPVTISAAGLAEEALELMNRHKVTAVFVTEDDDRARPVGLIHIHDFMNLDRS